MTSLKFREGLGSGEANLAHMKSCFVNENNTAGFVDSTGHRTASNLPNNML